MISGLKRSQINTARRQLRGWYNRPVGRLLLEQERAQLDRILPTLFGYHLLQVGMLLGDDLLSGSRVSHCVVLDADYESETLKPGLNAYPDALPIASDSIDVVVLPHTLEFDRDPHQILREVERVLIAEGHVVVLGFNPLSLWGAWRLLLRRRNQPPWNGDFLTRTRIKDWMALMGFDLISLDPHSFRPPIQRKGIMKKLQFMEKLGPRLWPRLSGAYILVAQKRVTTLTPLKPRWRPRRSLIGELLPPATRTSRSQKNV